MQVKASVTEIVTLEDSAMAEVTEKVKTQILRKNLQCNHVFNLKDNGELIVEKLEFPDERVFVRLATDDENALYNAKQLFAPHLKMLGCEK